MLESVLIANRGEIALRIVRACRELGIRSIVAHSTVDRDSAATRLADQTVQVGPAAARRSYLNMPALIEAALRTGAQAVHPGYGFLSENPDFAEVCEAHELVFVGPPAAVLAELGDKSRARAAMAAAGVPVAPGSDGPVPDLGAAERAAAAIGYPVIIKAVAGGGGRGICAVHSPAELRDAYARTATQAQAVFGDGRVFLERCIKGARHVEIQILADHDGTTLQLGERDCSVQRRHQKLIEETPAAGLPAGLLAEMAAAAVRGARAVGYIGAGTFEFLVDTDGAFWFIEANCRLQVEHPVTEMVTGLDLVRAQLEIASGQRLGLRQEDIRPTGVAIECRVNAESPELGFAPTPGRLDEFVPPGGPFVRVDTHMQPGAAIPAEYDSLLAKVVAWAPDRASAIARMDRALAELRISGPRVSTTTSFLREILAHPLFADSKHTVSLVDQVLAADSPASAGH